MKRSQTVSALLKDFSVQQALFELLPAVLMRTVNFLELIIATLLTNPHVNDDEVGDGAVATLNSLLQDVHSLGLIKEWSSNEKIVTALLELRLTFSDLKTAGGRCLQALQIIIAFYSKPGVMELMTTDEKLSLLALSELKFDNFESEIQTLASSRTGKELAGLLILPFTQ